ncbi:hypothetical protein cypCar_00010788 [Cyprinus carpio]|nr:hypothetical protein cypCar_00010788 [Cyprinus carpio]
MQLPCQHTVSTYYIFQLQNEIILADTEAYDDQSNEAVNRLIAITSELERWHEMEPKLLTNSPEVLLAVGKEELQRLNSQLKMVLSCSQAKLDAQKKILKRCNAKFFLFFSLSLSV